MKQKHTLQWLSAVSRQSQRRLVGAAGSGADRAERFQHRLCVCAAAHYQYGCGRGMGRLLGMRWLLLVGILLGQIVLSAAGRFLSEYTSSAVENRFKHRLFSALLTGDYASVAAVHSGEWMNRLTSDTTVVAGGVTQIVPGLIGMLVRLLGAVDRYFVARTALFVHLCSPAAQP